MTVDAKTDPPKPAAASSNSACVICGNPPEAHDGHIVQHPFEDVIPNQVAERLDQEPAQTAGNPAEGSRIRVEAPAPHVTRNSAQAQDSLKEQMIRVHYRAHQDGEWDAADWIARRFFNA
jgi:hypothetical protein